MLSATAHDSSVQSLQLGRSHICTDLRHFLFSDALLLVLFYDSLLLLVLFKSLGLHRNSDWDVISSRIVMELLRLFTWLGS